jgi:hypothetical protein
MLSMQHQVSIRSASAAYGHWCRRWCLEGGGMRGGAPLGLHAQGFFGGAAAAACLSVHTMLMAGGDGGGGVGVGGGLHLWTCKRSRDPGGGGSQPLLAHKVLHSLAQVCVL